MTDSNKVIVILNDITRIKELEETSYKIRSMFFASIAHELRTPLNSIIPMCERLEQLVQDNKQQTIVKVVKNSAVYL